jgi:hypothetical protein
MEKEMNMDIVLKDHIDRMVYISTFREGMKAHTRGVVPDQCPYLVGGISHLGWTEGWYEADFEEKGL